MNGTPLPLQRPERLVENEHVELKPDGRQMSNLEQ